MKCFKFLVKGKECSPIKLSCCLIFYSIQFNDGSLFDKNIETMKNYSKDGGMNKKIFV